MDTAKTQGSATKVVEEAGQTASAAEAVKVQTAFQVHQDELLAELSESIGQFCDAQQVV